MGRGAVVNVSDGKKAFSGIVRLVNASSTGSGRVLTLLLNPPGSGKVMNLLSLICGVSTTATSAGIRENLLQNFTYTGEGGTIGTNYALRSVCPHQSGSNSVARLWIPTSTGALLPLNSCVTGLTDAQASSRISSLANRTNQRRVVLTKWPGISCLLVPGQGIAILNVSTYAGADLFGRLMWTEE